MNLLPPEIVHMVFRMLNTSILKNCRLVNQAWQEISSHFLQIQCRGVINTENAMKNFISTFGSCVNIPLKKFSFSEKLFFRKSTESELIQFANKFGYLINEFQISSCRRILLEESRAEADEESDDIDENRPHTRSKLIQMVKTLGLMLSQMPNTENLFLKTSFDLGKIGLGHMSKLKNVLLRSLSSKYSTNDSLLLELSLLPNLFSFKFQEQNFEILFNILLNVERNSPNVQLFHQKIYLKEEDAINPIVDEVFEKRVKFRELGIAFLFYKEDVEQIRTLISKFSNWMSLQAQSLTKLALLTACNYDYALGTSIFETLEELDLKGSPFAPKLFPFQFPVVKILNVQTRFYPTFSGTVWEKVTTFNLDMIFHQAQYSWSQILPNVTTLKVQVTRADIFAAEEYQVAFSFVGVKHLKIISPRNSRAEWDHYTGGELIMDYKDVLAIQDSTNSPIIRQSRRFSLKSLQVLETLELSFCSLEGVRALLYLSKTRQIPRLQSIHINHCVTPSKRVGVGLAALKQFHENVTTK